MYSTRFSESLTDLLSCNGKDVSVKFRSPVNTNCYNNYDKEEDTVSFENRTSSKVDKGHITSKVVVKLLYKMETNLL